MDEPKKQEALDPEKKTGRNQEGDLQHGESLDDVRLELKRVTLELDACKKALQQKDELASALRDKLESKKTNEREASLERMAFDLAKAQEIGNMGSWVLDIDSGDVTWSGQLHKMFHHDPSSPAPSLAEQELWYTKKSWEAMLNAVAKSCKDGSPYNIELETVRRDGSIGILRSIGEVERDETGRIIRLRGIAQDISDVKETEAQLNQALQKAKTAQIHKDQFLANMSHEIRTPMNGMVGFANLLRDENLNSATRDQYISTIESCSKQLLNLIDDIIDVAKIEAGEIKVRKKPFNLAELIEETHATLEQTKDDKGKGHIQFVTRIPKGSEELWIDSDRLRIQQILTNLISNAIKFSDKGEVALGFELKEGAVEFFVQDQGIGIEPERAERIFERFEHLEGTDQKYEGTGLGLAISKGLTELLGGVLKLESTLGEGSTFRFEIPGKATDPKEDEPSHGSKETPSDQGPSYTVLVAEDDRINLKLIQKIFSKSPHEIIWTGNGEEAIQAYREHSEIDVVLMDIRMPVMNGDVAAQEILEMDEDAKIIAQTAYAMQEEREKFLRIGFLDYISKPYTPQALLAMVDKWGSR